MNIPARLKRYKLAISMAVAVVLCTGLVWGLQARVERQPGYVSVRGDISTPQQREVLRLLSGIDHPGDIQIIKRHLEKVGWIHRVDVARDWPEGLIVTVHEEEAIAYWNDNAFIDEDGSVFQSPWEEGGRLPQLYGPEGKEKEVMSQYQQLSQALLRTGQAIDTLVLDERGGWQFTDRSGMRVRLGKDNIMERMQRYFLVFQRAKLLEEMAKIRSVDTRYPDGVAVDWKDAVDGYEVAKAYKTQREMSL